jgi:hypothetical protein
MRAKNARVENAVPEVPRTLVGVSRFGVHGGELVAHRFPPRLNPLIDCRPRRRLRQSRQGSVQALGKEVRFVLD